MEQVLSFIRPIDSARILHLTEVERHLSSLLITEGTLTVITRLMKLPMIHLQKSGSFLSSASITFIDEG